MRTDLETKVAVEDQINRCRFQMGGRDLKMAIACRKWIQMMVLNS